MTIFYYAGKAGYGILAYHKTEEFRFYMHAEDVIGSDAYEESDFDIRMASNTSVLNLKKALEDKGYKNIGDGLWER